MDRSGTRFAHASAPIHAKETMKSVLEGKQAWERTLSRYFAAHGVDLRWSYPARRFLGVAGHTFARLNPKKEDKMWSRMPDYIRKYETADGKQVVIIATNRGYGDSVDDSMVVMRLGTFIPMLKALIETDRERWTDVTDH